MPALALEVYYGVAGGPTAELASGGDFSGHADFINAWNQPTLERLVDRPTSTAHAGAASAPRTVPGAFPGTVLIAN